MRIPDHVLEAVQAEYERATESNLAFHSAHEGFAVLLEEVDELKRWVWVKPKDRDVEQMEKEAIQVAAMGIRFILDVCLVEKERPR